MSNFSVTNRVFGDLTEFVILNEKTGESATIVSDFGCNTRELVLRKGIELYDVIKGHNLAAKLKKKYSTCAMLTPFVNRIRDGNYSFNGKNYQLKVNKPKEGVAIHGLLYNQIFELKKKTIKKDSITLLFEHKIMANDFKGYPFSLIVQKEFTLLSECGFHIKTTIKNAGNYDAPIGDGWHPYFSIEAENLNNLTLQVPSSTYYTNDERNIVEKKYKVRGRMDYQKGRVIGTTKFDTCFTDLKFKKNTAQTILHGVDVSIVLWQDKQYPYIQVYIPSNRKSIAIEPMTSAADAFNTGDGLIILPSGETFSGEYGIYLK